MTSGERDIIKSFCEKIAKERDPQKFSELAYELDAWLSYFLPKEKSATQS